MNHKPEIEEILAAAQRQHADSIRQEKLREAIIRVAEAEDKSHNKAKKVWIVAGIAASLLLVISIGWNFIGRSTSPENSKPLLAKKSPASQGNTYNDSTATYIPTQNRQHPNVIAKANNRQKNDDHNVSTQENNIIDNNQTVAEESFIANENEQTLIVHNTNHQETQDTESPIDSTPRIQERTSVRIVRSNNSTSQHSLYQDNTPQFASLNCRSSSASFKLGTIHFQ